MSDILLNLSDSTQVSTCIYSCFSCFTHTVHLMQQALTVTKCMKSSGAAEARQPPTKGQKIKADYIFKKNDAH